MRRVMEGKRWAAVLLAMAATWVGVAGVAADRVVLLDGEATEGRVLSIDAGERVVVEGVAGEPVELQGLRRIEPTRAEAAMIRRPAVMVYLADGGVLKAEGVTVRAQSCRVSGTIAVGELDLPAELVRGLALAPNADPAGKPRVDETFVAALTDRTDVRDRLFVMREGKVQSVPGMLESLDESELRFVWNDQSRALARSKVYGVVLAAVGPGVEAMGRCRVSLADGSVLWGKVVTLREGLLRLRLSEREGVAEVDLPWEQVARVEVRSRRMVFVSDLEPESARVEAGYSIAGWRADRTVLGRALMLGGRSYEKGLGMHAPVSLTYRLDGRFSRLAATAGLDAASGARGDCVMAAMGDGRELWRQRVRGGEEPRAVSVDVTGVRQLTLSVEMGEDADLDFGDHANWADARLLRDVK